MRGRAQKACTAARIQIGFRRERDIAAHCDRPARKARANRGLQPWWLMPATPHGRYAVCSSKPHSYPRRTGPTCSHGRSSRQAPGSSTRATEGAGRVVRPRAAAVDAQACTELSKPDRQYTGGVGWTRTSVGIALPSDNSIFNRDGCGTCACSPGNLVIWERVFQLVLYAQRPQEHRGFEAARAARLFRGQRGCPSPHESVAARPVQLVRKCNGPRDVHPAVASRSKLPKLV